MPKTSSNSQTQMPSSPSSAGTPEPEKSQQPRPSAIMENILTLMESDRAQGHEPVHPLLGGAPADAVLLQHPELAGAHGVFLPAALRPLTKALASSTPAVAVSPQQP